MKHRKTVAISVSMIIACLGLLSFSVPSLATKKSNEQAYVSCTNGCWRSDKYCRKYQTKIMDCNKQLGKCLDWCEDAYDMPIGTLEIKPTKIPIFLEPAQKNQKAAPTKPTSKPTKRTPVKNSNNLQK